MQLAAVACKLDRLVRMVPARDVTSLHTSVLSDTAQIIAQKASSIIVYTRGMFSTRFWQMN
jgi:hypothetical protein